MISNYLPDLLIFLEYFMPTQSSLLKELNQLQPSADFVHRHIGANQAQQQAMLQFLELQSLEDLLENL